MQRLPDGGRKEELVTAETTTASKWTCRAPVGYHEHEYCNAPARWLCVKDRAKYCDEHAHVHSCCQMAGPHEGEED